MTLDVILQTVFGMQPGLEYDALHRLAREFMEGARGTGGNLATMLLPAAMVRRLMLGPRGPDMALLKEPLPLRFLGRTPGVREGRELVERLMEQVRVRRAHLDDGGTDALARILRHADESGVPLGDAELVDELLTLLLGGHETTAVVLGWLLYRLAGQPDAWARARAELDEAFGDGPLDARRAARLPYLGAVVQESLRLDGLTLGVMRRTRREVVIDGYTIPAGTLVNAQVRHVHLDPARFDDPLAFRPERLLGGERLSPIDFAPVRRRLPPVRGRGLRHLRAQHADRRHRAARGAPRPSGPPRGPRAVRPLPRAEQRDPARGAEPPLRHMRGRGVVPAVLGIMFSGVLPFSMGCGRVESTASEDSPTPPHEPPSAAPSAPSGPLRPAREAAQVEVDQRAERALMAAGLTEANVQRLAAAVQQEASFAIAVEAAECRKLPSGEYEAAILTLRTMTQECPREPRG
jgi:hypothetical protein